MRIAYKFLAQGSVSPFTGYRWPAPGAWVSAPAGRDDAWVHACRPGDLPYWLEEELWRVELDDPVREARYQVAAPRARLVARIGAWDAALRAEYTRTCALHARDVALPYLAPPLRDAVSRRDDVAEIAAAARAAQPGSHLTGYLADAARHAVTGAPAMTSYVACTLAGSAGGGLAAFEAERAWQARWLAERLAIPWPDAVQG
jgi:hypothetical protein